MPQTSRQSWCNYLFYIQFTLDVGDLGHLNSKTLLHQYWVITYKHCLTGYFP